MNVSIYVIECVVMCELDYLLAGMYHARLYREQTLADGGSICDYWFVGDQEPEQM